MSACGTRDIPPHSLGATAHCCCPLEYHCGEVDVCQFRDQDYTDVAHFNFSDDHTVAQLGGNPVYTGGELVGVVRYPRAVFHIPTQVLQETAEHTIRKC